MSEPTWVPVNDETLEQYRISATEDDKFDPGENHCIRRLIARIDLERNRADEAERKLEHELEHHDGDWEVDDHAAEAEIERLRAYVRMWASDECDDPEDHAQRHSSNGVAQGHCQRCNMSWPCPSSLVAVEFPTMLDLVDDAALAAPPDPKEPSE